jgi:hypothetical protein
MKKITFLIVLLFVITVNAQVGVGTTSPIDGSILDVESTDKGVMIPRMDITDLTTLAPVTKLAASPEPVGLLVFNTDASNSGANAGFFYWDGNDWVAVGGSGTSNDWNLLGNAGTAGGTINTDGTNFIGTTDNQNLNFRTNGALRGRFSNLGEFFVGTQSTILPGDLMNAVGNATFPFALNGYTDFDGAGVYGLVESGNTAFAAVQGEYDGTNRFGPGVRGITFNPTAGLDFLGSSVSGISGSLLTGDAQRAFGVMGDTGNNLSRRTGGVIGTDFFAAGALGYYAQNFISYGVYAFGNPRVDGGVNGRMTNENSIDTHVGMGIHGGFMGGWIKGKEYGVLLSGERFGAYTNGKTITNDVFVVLDQKADGEKQATFASTSLSIDVQAKGIGQLANGIARITFDKNFSDLIDQNKPIIVTITPFGESNGVHIVSVDKNGFSIKENNNGFSNVKFNWIAIAEKSNKDNKVSKEILTEKFDENISSFMHNENLDGGSAIWTENGEVKFGERAPKNEEKIKTYEARPKISRPRENKKN